jgi:cell wall-associated NlpC family hydrolase
MIDRNTRSRRLVVLVGHALIAVFVWACAESKDKPGEAVPQPVVADAVPATPVIEYTPTALAGLERYNLACGGTEMALSGPVTRIAKAISDSAFRYNVKPLTDCSGIFHRVLKRMKRVCPDYDYPDVEAYRDSRDLARWYHERDELILIDDPLKYSDLIKPGAVLFYGQRDAVYTNFTAEQLFERGTGINHVGVVVKVHKNAQGKVSRYELLHGHGRPGKTVASTTNYHWRKPPNTRNRPYGNGKEQWVAFAVLANPAGTPLTSK